MQGHILQRSKGSWTVVVDLGRDPTTGKRRQLWRTSRGRKRDAEALLANLINQRETGIDAPPGRLKVADFLKLWLSNYAKRNTASRTSGRYEELIRLYITPSVGELVLTKLRPLQIEQAYTAIAERGLSPRTILQIHRVLRQALKHAVQWQLLSVNPADAVKPPRFERYEPKVFRPAELRTLFAQLDGTRYGALIRTAASTGLRLGELLGLRWSDVDLDAGVLQVRQTSQWITGEGVSFKPPKTHRSRRPVSLSDAVVEALRSHRLVQLSERLLLGPAYDDQDLVFATRTGTPINPSNVSRAWRSTLEKAGLTHRRFHDLRHTHATFLMAQGVHPKVVSERLGHAGVSITLDTYSHVTPGLQEDAAAQFEEMLASG